MSWTEHYALIYSTLYNGIFYLYVYIVIGIIITIQKSAIAKHFFEGLDIATPAVTHTFYSCQASSHIKTHFNFVPYGLSGKYTYKKHTPSLYHLCIATKGIQTLTYSISVSRGPRGKHLCNPPQLARLSTPAGEHPAILGKQRQVIVPRGHLDYWNIC